MRRREQRVRFGQTEEGNLERENLDSRVHEDRKDNIRFNKISQSCPSAGKQFG